MMTDIKRYSTLVFDCDGVILNSNHVKTEAFYQAALPYGEKAAQSLVDYHVQNGGISRYKKFEYFITQIAGSTKGPGFDELLDRYASRVLDGLMTCDIADGLQELRANTKNAGWMVASGGDQSELRAIFSTRGLAELFDRGIYGSPDSKDTILAREFDSIGNQKPAVFLGDSKYDYRASQAAELDFVFVSNWSEVSDWQSWVAENRITTVESLHALG